MVNNDAFRGYKISNCASWEDYTYTEAVKGNIKLGYKDSFESQAHPLLASVNSIGRNFPAFTRIGRWKAGQVADRNAPVLLPYYHFDIDGQTLDVARADTEAIIEELLILGIDGGHIEVYFSGKKGFHISVPTSQIGLSLFSDSLAAYKTAYEFVATISNRAGVVVDQSVCSPLTHFRLPGTPHDETEFRKTRFAVSEFLSIDMFHILVNSRNHRPFDWNNPITAPFVEEAFKNFYGMVSRAEFKYRKGGNRRTGAPIYTPKLRRIAHHGVEPSRPFGGGPRDVGRNNAAFQLACFMIRRNEPNIESRLIEWNKRNAFPLPISRLKMQIRGAGRATESK